jgi:hypothetical protein
MVASDPLESGPFAEGPAAVSADPPDRTEGATAGTHGAATCPVTWCPICVTVGAVQPLAPDVIEHLLKAGTELFLAFRAVVDARVDEASGGGAEEPRRTTLEKIDLG